MTTRKLQDFRVRVITWNLGSTYPLEDLHSLLGVKAPFEVELLPDMIVVGLQEVSVRPDNMAYQAMFGDSWVNAFLSCLYRHDYVQLICNRLQGIILVVFTRREHLLFVRNVAVSRVRTGLAGFWGNKGACVVSFCVNDTWMSFVNAHLAAHDHEYRRRIMDYNAIVSMATLPNPAPHLLTHDYVFWFGDLNFRLDDITLHELRTADENGTIVEMLIYDQLKRAQSSSEAFEMFDELPINFRPTFKFVIGTSDYKFKNRKPAWTDRILFRCAETRKDQSDEPLSIKGEEYCSHEDYVQSDHKPVSALFTVKVLERRDPPADKVYFLNTTDWTLQDGFEIWFCTAATARLRRTDWIALLPHRFTSLERYRAFVWVDTQRATRTGHPDDVILRDGDELLPSPRLLYRQIFTDRAGIAPGYYVLVYFRSTCDVLGISPPFEILETEWEL